MYVNKSGSDSIDNIFVLYKPLDSARLAQNLLNNLRTGQV